jgi:hypothetical protein
MFTWSSLSGIWLISVARKLYRAEDFSRSAKIYRDLSSENLSTELNDLRINRGALDAQLIWSGNSALATFKKPGREDLEAFETAYNSACVSLARGELRQAEILLRRANRMVAGQSTDTKLTATRTLQAFGGAVRRGEARRTAANQRAAASCSRTVGED